jgi:hypothetical protein
MMCRRVETARGAQQIGEREVRGEVKRLIGEDRAQRALGAGAITGGGIRGRDLDGERRLRLVELADDLVVLGEQLGGALERVDGSAELAGLAQATSGLDHERCRFGLVVDRAGLPQQCGGVRTRIALRPLRELLERGDVLGRATEQLVERCIRRGLVAAGLERLDESEPQRGDVRRRCTVGDGLRDALREDIGSFASASFACEYRRVVDEAADIVGRVLRRRRDEIRRAAHLAGLLECASLCTQQHRLVDAAHAVGELAANGGDLAPALELGQHFLEGAPRFDIRLAALDDRSIHSGSLIEPTGVAVQLAGGTQRGAPAIVLRDLGDLLEGLRCLHRRTGAAIQPCQAIVVRDIVRLHCDDGLHRLDRLDALTLVLVDVGELLVECRRDIGALDRSARFVGEQEDELFREALLARKRAQLAPRLVVARRVPDGRDRGAHRMDRTTPACTLLDRRRSQALPAAGSFVLGHARL